MDDTEEYNGFTNIETWSLQDYLRRRPEVFTRVRNLTTWYDIRDWCERLRDDMRAFLVLGRGLHPSELWAFDLLYKVGSLHRVDWKQVIEVIKQGSAN